MLASSSSSSSLVRLYSRTLKLNRQARFLTTHADEDSAPSSSKVPAFQPGVRGVKPLKSGSVKPNLKDHPVVDNLHNGGQEPNESEFRRRRMQAITQQLSRQKSLTPAVVAFRAKQICEAEGAEAGHNWVKTVPMNLQTPVLWNTVMHQALVEGRTQFAFKVYNDMKRRGTNPTPITFTTFFSALASSKAQEEFPKQIEMAHSLLNQYKNMLQSGKLVSGTQGPDLVLPLNHAMRFFEKVDDYDTFFDIYNSIEDDLKLVRNVHTFYALFYGIYHRKSTSKTTGLSVAEQNASDVKLFWREVEQARSKHKMLMSSIYLTPALVVLAAGRDADRKFARKLIDDHLVRAGKSRKATITIQQPLFEAIMEVYAADGSAQDCLDLAEALQEHATSRGKPRKSSPYRFNGSVQLKPRSLHHCMMAYAALSGMTLFEKNSSYNTSDSASPTEDQETTPAESSPAPPRAPPNARYARKAVELCRWSFTEAAIQSTHLELLRMTWELMFRLCEHESDYTSARELFSLLLNHLRKEMEKQSHLEDPSERDRLLKMPVRILNSLAQTALSTQDRNTYNDFMRLIESLNLTDRFAKSGPSKSLGSPPSYWQIPDAETPRRNPNRVGPARWEKYVEGVRQVHLALLDALIKICQTLVDHPNELANKEESRYRALIWSCRESRRRWEKEAWREEYSP